MTDLTNIVVTLILVGVFLGGFYTFMGDIFSSAQIEGVQSNLSGVNMTVNRMIDTSLEIKDSTDNLEPTGTGTGFISTTINGIIIAGKAVASSIDSLADIMSSLFRVFGIPTGEGSVIYMGLLAAFTVIIVFAIFKAIGGNE